MRLNTKMRYGTRAMLELAMHYQEGAVSLNEVAASQEISAKYLEVLFSSLRLAGIVRGQRGSKGGYVLARPPEHINLRELFDILESPEPYVACTLEHNACHRRASCVTQDVWAQMFTASMHVLESVTLADLVARSNKHSTTSASYSI
ncbi:MAG: RrF2 family transcriptional regulator [Anaerolineae bacterium]